MLYCASLLSLLLSAATGCSRATPDYGFKVNEVELQTGLRRLDLRFRNDLVFSPEAIEALEHGVTLIINLDMELRDSGNLILLANERRSFAIRHLPLSQHYQLSDEHTGESRTFPRLRHAVSALSSLDLAFATGALAPGNYELRARLRLDQSALPAPMQLPAVLSARWRHDSEWSTWPFTISA